MATPQQRLAEAERLRALGESINDQQKEQLDLLDAANERYAQQISSVKDLSSYLQKSLQIEGKMAESFDDMFRAFAPVNDKAGDLYKSLTSNPINLLSYKYLSINSCYFDLTSSFS